MNTILWTLAIGLGAVLILQGVALRIAYRRKVAILQARQLQTQNDMNGKLEQTKRHIGQLQSDLSAARQQLKQLGKKAASSTRVDAATRHALECELDDAMASEHARPVDGFADTQVSPQDTQHGSLLLQ